MRRFIVFFLVATFLLSPIFLLILALEGSPVVEANPPASAVDVERTKSALQKLGPLVNPDFDGRLHSISQAEINSALTVAARVLPSFRGRASVSSDDIALILSIRAANPLADAWLNLSVSVAPSNHGLDLNAVKLGRLWIPESLALSISRLIVKTMVGDDVVGVVTKSVNEVRVQGDSISVGIGLTASERRILLARGKNLFLAFSLLDDSQTVHLYYSAIDQAVNNGRLPQDGTFVSYLRFALDLAEVRSSHTGPTKEIRSAIVALAIYCGHPIVQLLVGDVFTGVSKTRRSRCRDVTLAGNRDFRQHFIISAALEAVSEPGMAFAAGEFKELLDSIPGGSGFNFEELAADRAGMHFTARILESALMESERRSLLRKLESEAAFFPDTSDLPETMSEKDFEKNFKSVDSGKYLSILAKIDHRITSLPFHAKH